MIADFSGAFPPLHRPPYTIPAPTTSLIPFRSSLNVVSSLNRSKEYLVLLADISMFLDQPRWAVVCSPSTDLRQITVSFAVFPNSIPVLPSHFLKVGTDRARRGPSIGEPPDGIACSSAAASLPENGSLNPSPTPDCPHMRTVKAAIANARRNSGSFPPGRRIHFCKGVDTLQP